MIGIGKPTTREYRLSPSVFLSSVQKTGLRKNKSKYFVPTHGLPQTPRTTLKSLNAITAKAIGMYLNTRKYRIPGSITTYNCQWRLKLRRSLRPKLPLIGPIAPDVSRVRATAEANSGRLF